jgi:hypothetical protein
MFVALLPYSYQPPPTPLTTQLILTPPLQYVNENYQGKGAAEYQYYDPYTSSWDKTACSTVDDSPCTKMDCHLSSTSFSLLGFFKHKIIDDWMEQLFKHQGICTWDDEDYAFMKEARKAWPEGCTPTYKTTNSGQKLYYDLKPMYGGEVSIAMYIDEECVTEYYMSADKIEAIIGNILVEGGSGDKGGGEYDFSAPPPPPAESMILVPNLFPNHSLVGIRHLIFGMFVIHVWHMI